VKVVHLNTSDFGGAAMAAVRLHLFLLEQGMDSDFLTLNKTRGDIPRHHLVDPFALKGSSILRYKFRRFLEKLSVVEDKSNQPDNFYLKDKSNAREIFTLPYSFFALSNHPLIQSADIVHIHWVSYGMLDERNFFSECRKPKVWTMHDMHPITGGCHHADECEGYYADCKICPQLKHSEKAHQYWKYKEYGVQQFLSGSNAVVCPSEWLARGVKRSLLWKESTPHVIPNGTDSRVFKSRARNKCKEELGITSSMRVVLFNAFDVANTRKGISLLLDALNQIERDDLLVVAIGSTASLVSRHPIKSTGYLRDEELIAKYYGAADVFVLPSMAENLPNTIAESLMCGTPCVAFEVGGIPEMLNERNGILVKRGNPVALKEALEKALGSNWNYNHISQDATSIYDIKNIGHKYVALYQGIL